MSADEQPSWLFLAWSGLWLCCAWLLVMPVLWWLEARDGLSAAWRRLSYRVWFARLEPYEQRFVRECWEDPASMIKRGEL